MVLERARCQRRPLLRLIDSRYALVGGNDLTLDERLCHFSDISADKSETSEDRVLGDS